MSPRCRALIPARGGSKRLPRKNIAPFHGRPMLAWTVEAALESGVFEQVVVSTEDAEIAAVARAAGAEVLERPDDAATDAATLVDVAHHALSVWGTGFDGLGLLLANCPLRSAEDIRGSHEVFFRDAPPALLTVVGYGWVPPFRALRDGADGLEAVFPEWLAKKSQAYPDALCPSGAIHWSAPARLAAANDLYLDGIRGYRLPWHRGIDIDTLEDFELAACIKHALDRGFRFTP